jgi:hypothetical protein
MGMTAISATTNSQKETVMSTKSKVAAALAVLTLATSVALPISEAEARGRGWGIAAGLFGAAIVGAAIAEAEANAYPEDNYGHRRCRVERVYDDAGFYLRTARVCRYY